MQHRTKMRSVALSCWTVVYMWSKESGEHGTEAVVIRLIVEPLVNSALYIRCGTF